MTTDALPSTAYATRLLAASSRLSEPGRSIFDRIFIKGDSEAMVQRDLDLSADAFAKTKASVLRTLMIAAQ